MSEYEEGEGYFVLDIEGSQMIDEDGEVYEITEWLDEDESPCLRHQATFAFGRSKTSDSWLQVNIKMLESNRLH